MFHELNPLCPALEFPEVGLSVDDMLPTDIALLLVYRRPVSDLSASLAAGLRAFPHLTGKAVDSPPRLVHDTEGEVVMEFEESAERQAVDDFERMPYEEMMARFAPRGRMDGMFAVRRVDFPSTGLMAICLRVSHMAVDGTGLGLFLAHATAAARGVAAPPVVHDRSWLLSGARCGGGMPDGYTERRRMDAPGAGKPVWLAVPIDAAGSRHDFAAWLCGETARIVPGIGRVAVWCNTRGRGGPPPNYTGNAGCYQHVDVTGKDRELTCRIEALATRAGLTRARRMHQEILCMRATGREVWWDGPRGDVLELNLLSPPAAVADFGGGYPAFALLLSRNSSGLRVFPGVCGKRYVVEATLAPGVAEALVEACGKRGLAPDVWGGGGR